MQALDWGTAHADNLAMRASLHAMRPIAERLASRMTEQQLDDLLTMIHRYADMLATDDA
ncbi:MAG: hypothetical protein ACREQ5_14675 [Candidatus Dormibacteria bacterium]